MCPDGPVTQLGGVASTFQTGSGISPPQKPLICRHVLSLTSKKAKLDLLYPPPEA